MSWSKCEIKIALTGAADAMGTPLASIGIIKEKSTTFATSDGDKLSMKATGGILVATESFEGEATLTTRVVEPDHLTISQMLGTSVTAQAAALLAATTIKILKNSRAYANMYLSNGTVFAQVTAIDKTNGAYDTLTITLGAALLIGDSLYECNSIGNLLVKSQIVPDKYSVEISPKNSGGTGMRIRRSAVSYKPGYSEEEGHFVDMVFTIEPCADNELYTKFKKA